MKTLLRIAAFMLPLAVIFSAAFYRNPLWFNDQQIRLHLWHAHAHSKYIDAGGYRLHYYDAAPPDGSSGIPLVLVHGLGSRAEDWSAMIPSLTAAGFHVYALDLLGYGRSPRPAIACTVPVEEAVLVEFMRALALRHADLIGWSMGGWIAASLALDHPALVNRLVLDDSAGIFYPPSFARDSFTPYDSAGVERLMALLSPHPHALPPFVMRASLRRIAAERGIVQQTMDSMLSGRDLLDTRLHAITQPTLIVWGAEDALIPISVGETMQHDIPHSRLIAIPGCGHLAPAECARPVLAASIPFLKSVPQP